MKLNDPVDHAIFIVDALNSVELLLDVGLDVPVQLEQKILQQHCACVSAQGGGKGSEVV